MNGYGEATLGGVALSEITGFVGNEGAVSAADYTTVTAPGISQNRCSRLVVRLRCPACKRGSFIDGATSPQPCPGCGSGQLLLVGLWNLAPEDNALDPLVAPWAACGECCLPPCCCTCSKDGAPR
jgi:hypothetical protein